MKRVLHTIDTTGPGGAESVFITLATSLDPRYFESFVAIRGPGWVYDTLRKHGIEPLFINTKGSFSVNYLRQLTKTVRQLKIDVIQSHLFGSNLYCSMAGLLCQTPVISTMHGFVDADTSDRLLWLKRNVVNLGSSKIVFVSDHLRRHFVENVGFSGLKSATIYNGVDTSLFYPKKNVRIRKELGINSDNIVIGAVGNIRPAKGYHVFLRAARLILDQRPDCRFIIAGHGAGILYESLLQLRKELDLEESFFFIGYSQHAAELLNNFDIFISPSTSEGFSISTIEAIACGLPAIVTKSGGPEEIMERGGKGAVVDCQDTSIANKILEILHNKIDYFDRSPSDLDGFFATFSLTSTIEAYSSLYQQVTAE